jgi:hypothetical protein
MGPSDAALLKDLCTKLSSSAEVRVGWTKGAGFTVTVVRIDGSVPLAQASAPKLDAALRTCRARLLPKA